MELNVVVVEDHALLRVGLSRILESDGINVVAAADDIAGFEAALAAGGIDLALLDVRLPPTFTTEGLEAAVAARRSHSLPVIILSQHVEPVYARELLADGRGGVGYLLKDRVSEVEAFLTSVRQVAAGGTVLDPQVVARLLSGRETPISKLSERERTVLTLMAQGRSNAAIGNQLFLSDGAVAKHINSIFTKLDLPPASDDNRRVLAVLAWINAS